MRFKFYLRIKLILNHLKVKDTSEHESLYKCPIDEVDKDGKVINNE
tara:strand:- start:903 stop:1040 length:138 start_codon:yes stop_codon:yes gene_type:complete